jgi:hypothetical protein
VARGARDAQCAHVASLAHLRRGGGAAGGSSGAAAGAGLPLLREAAWGLRWWRRRGGGGDREGHLVGADRHWLPVVLDGQRVAVQESVAGGALADGHVDDAPLVAHAER